MYWSQTISAKGFGGVVLLLCVLTGCLTPVKLKEVPPEAAFRKMQRNAIATGTLSPHTEQVLRLYALTDAFAEDQRKAMQELRQRACTEHDRWLLFSMAELSFRTGLEHEKRPKEAIGYFFSSARFAYAFLFDENLGPAPNVYDPRFRLGCDLYNHSLARALRLIEETPSAEMESADALVFDTWDGPLRISLDMQGFEHVNETFSELLLATKYEVTGLTNEYRTFGLGIPMIAVAEPDPDNPNMPPRASYPATALLRFDILACEAGQPLDATLVLFDPLHVNETRIDGVDAPIETDMTTPLAYVLSDPALQRNPFIGLFRADRLEDETGLYMLEPYDPNRIPVVFVHGLVSSPLTWAQVMNDLRGDPILRERYQFWFYQYPTGLPFVFSAGKFREALVAVQQRYNPNRDQPAFEQMVLIGHSMGGLLSKMMVQDSGDVLWSAFSQRSLDDLRLSDYRRDLLQNTFYFKPVPWVKRVIFIATPHAGSNLSDLRIANLIARLIRVPTFIASTVFDVLTLDLGPERQLTERDLTSVKNLSPNNRMIQVTHELPIVDGVYFHSIIGNINEGENHDTWTDGVVTYRSAHLDGATSEYVVNANHTCHYHPLAIQEVRRILTEHTAGP